MVAATCTLTTGAHASSGDWDCPIDAYGCIFDGPLGTGDRYVIRSCDTFDLPRAWWDKADSVWSPDRLFTGYSYYANGSTSTYTTGYINHTADNIKYPNETDRIRVNCES
ncbi:hypothetical protein SAMN05421504_104696 [Amycolatopsis xylanica]|uniref:Peptidase inhibitor family I36 n=2 Tax=Amycolatopsis xylanica TaxID=589385 RepID=A0A1H3HK02_9PSEU|nr:hypothetical protein SAMN05421504_104696 [Amycolatopsis xylanica]